MSNYDYEPKHFRGQNKRRGSKSYYYRDLGDNVRVKSCCWWKTLWLFLLCNISIGNIVLTSLMNAPYTSIMMYGTPTKFSPCCSTTNSQTGENPVIFV